MSENLTKILHTSGNAPELEKALVKLYAKLGAEFGTAVVTMISRETPQWVTLSGRDCVPETQDRPTELLLLWAAGVVGWEPHLLAPDWAEALRGSWDDVYSHQWEQWVEKWGVLA